MTSTDIETLISDLSIIRERVVKLEQENGELKAALEAKPEPSEAVNRLLDLIQTDIEWHEKYRPDSEKMKPIITAYREIRPK